MFSMFYLVTESLQQIICKLSLNLHLSAKNRAQPIHLFADIIDQYWPFIDWSVSVQELCQYERFFGL